MQAVILAAGVGKRLKPLTQTLPKGLITMGGKSLLEHSLDALEENGIKETIIVVGYLKEAVKEKLSDEYKGIRITYVVNEEYGKTGSMYSFSKAKDAIRGNDVLLLESDLLYDYTALPILINAEFNNCILVAEVSNSGDEVYICVDKNQRIIGLGKNIPEENKKNAVGELVGISRFSKEFLSQLFRKAEEDYKRGELNYHYEECVFAVSKQGKPVYAVLSRDLVWVEIDKESDLKRAQEYVYPKIMGLSSSRLGK